LPIPQKYLLSQKICDAIRDNPNLTQADLSLIIGVANSTIEKNIRVLKSQGVIERKGSKKKEYWSIS
jgi:predicted HTH transcriptional regulator